MKLSWPLRQVQAHLCRWDTLLPVPLQSSVIVPVEEVCLCASRPHVWVNPYELQNSSSSAFFHADDDGIRQLLIPKLWITHGGAESVVPDDGHSQRRSLVEFQPRCLAVARSHIQRQDAGQGFPNASFFSISQGALTVEHRISWSLHDGIGREERTVAQIWQEKGQHANGCSCEPVWERKKTTEEEHACHLSMDSAWFAGWIAFDLIVSDCWESFHWTDCPLSPEQELKNRQLLLLVSTPITSWRNMFTPSTRAPSLQSALHWVWKLHPSCKSPGRLHGHHCALMRGRGSALSDSSKPTGRQKIFQHGDVRASLH